MHTTNLRKVGGSIMLAVPRALLDVLHLTAGARVGLAVDNVDLARVLGAARGRKGQQRGICVQRDRHARHRLLSRGFL